MTLEEAKKQSKVLHDTATELLDTYQIKDLFTPIGDLTTVGSYSYGLMVIPDIDFNIYCKDPTVFNDQISNIVNILMKKEGVVKVSVVKSGFYVPAEDGKPKGIWIGINIFFKEKIWNIDTWILQKAEAEAVPLGFDVDKLSQAQKDRILLLKAQLNEQGKYGRKSTYYSAQVYKAIVNGNISTVEELENWNQNI